MVPRSSELRRLGLQLQRQLQADVDVRRASGTYSSQQLTPSAAAGCKRFHSLSTRRLAVNWQRILHAA